MTKVDVSCSCGKKYRVSSELLGKKVKCKACGGKVPVELSLGDDEPAEEETAPEEKQPATKRARLGTTARRRSSAPAHDDRRDDRRSAPNPLASMAASPFILRFAGAFAIATIVLFVIGQRETRLAEVAKPEAKAMTCAELEKNGYGDNAHISLSNFVICDNGVYEAEKTRTGGERWTAVWIPAVPDDGEYVRQIGAMVLARNGELPKKLPPPKDVKLLLKSKSVGSRDDVARVFDREKLEGVVVNEIESLDGETQRTLRKAYPGIDFKKCWILEVGRTAEGGGGHYALALLTGVIAIALIGIKLAGSR